MKRFLWSTFIFLILGSCLEEPECVNMNNGLLNISFKKMFDGKTDTVVFVGIQPLNSDSIFYPYSLATAVTLPLNPYTSETQYSFLSIYQKNEFLKMNYDTEIQVVSEECGARYVFSELDFLDNNFDSVKVVTTNLPGSPNLEVYRCPRTNLAKMRFRQLVNSVEVADTLYVTNITANFLTPVFIPGEALTSVNLPLNPQALSTTYTFNFTDGSTGNLTFSYSSTSWNEFESQCGSLTLFSDVLVSASNFTNVLIRKDSIQDPPITNGAIFR